MSVILIKAAQLITSLSILVVLHELGHYIPAKLFKTRVEKFYLFFNPWFSLFKKKIGETEWGIGWLPLGGYVKISGMVDESMDKEQLAQPAQPWEFRAKPAWQRLIIMIGGVTVNVILGIIIYICLFFAYGSETIDPSRIEKGLAVAPLLEKHGFRQGDVVLRIHGENVEHAVNDVNKEIMLRNASEFEVKHQDGSIEKIILPDDIDYQLFKSGMTPVGLRLYPNVLDSIPEFYDEEKVSPSHNKLKKGDRLLAINKKDIVYFDDLQSELYSWRNKNVDLLVLRGSDTIRETIKITENGALGVFFEKPQIAFDTNLVVTKYYGFGESISKGTSYGIETIGDYASQLKYLFTEKGASSVGGFAAIGNLFPPSWNWRAFWEITALLSMILAFMNILPIPALDGGHVVFLLYEMITGREAPQKVLEYAQIVGFVILMSLLLYANGNDIFKAITGN